MNEHPETPSPPPQAQPLRPPAAQRPRRRWLRRTLLALVVVLVVLPLSLLALLMITLRTETGRSYVVAAAEWAAADFAGLDLSIGRLEGPLPQRLELFDVEVADAEGRLVGIDHLVLSWRPSALLQRQVDILALEAGRVELDRLPAGSEEPSPPREGPLRLALPELPVSLSLDRLQVEELALGEAVAGAPALLRTGGHASLQRDGEVRADVTVERIDDRPGQLHAVLALTADGERLTARIEGAEPAGGLVARMLDLPGLPAMRISLDGDGPPRGWEARLEIEAEDTARLTADLHLDDIEPLAFQVQGHAEAAALLPPDLRQLGEAGLDFGLRVSRSTAGLVEIHELTLAGPAAQLTAEATLQPDGESFATSALLEVLDAAALQPLVEPLGFSGGRVTLEASGTISEPVFEAEARLTDLLLPEAALGEAVLKLSGQSQAPLDTPEGALAFRLDLAGESLLLLDPALAQAAQGDPTILAEGVVHLESRRLEIHQLDVAVADARLLASGEAALAEAGPSALLDLQLMHPDLARFAGLAGLDLAGGLALDSHVELATSGILEARIDARGEGLRLGIPAADALLGEQPAIAGRVTRTDQGALRVEQFRLEGGAMTLNADALLSADFSDLDAGYQLRIPQLQPLGEALDQPLSGSLELIGTAVGPLATPRVEARLQGDELLLPGDPLRSLTLELATELDAPGPRGTVRINGDGPYGTLEGGTDFALAEERLTLDSLRLTQGADTRISGNLSLPLDGTPGSGEIEGRVGRLSALTGLLGTEIEGQLTLRATLSPDGPRQSLDGSLSVAELRLGPAGDPSLQGQSATLDFGLRDLLGTPGGQARLTAAGLSAGGALIESVEAEASGNLEALQVTLDAQGEAEEPLRLQAAAQLSLAGDSPHVSLNRLDADWGEETVRLAQPARLTLGTGDLRIEDLDLEVLGGRLAGAARQQGNALQADLALSSVPMERLSALSGGTRLEGVLSGNLTLSGQMNAPSGRLSLRIENFGFADSDAGHRPPLDLLAEAVLEPGSLVLDASLRGFAETPLLLQASLPVRVSLQPFAFDTLSDQPLSARLDWNGEIGPIMALLPVDSIRLNGIADIDLRASGTLASPQLGGQIALTQGRYENFTSGTLLDPFEMLLTGAGNALTLERLEAGDGGRGVMDGGGTLVWRGEEGIDADLRVSLRNMTLVRRDDVVARLTGQLELVGNLLERADLTGQLRNDEIEGRLVDVLPPSVAEIEVIEVRAGQEIPERDDTPPPRAAASPLFLDVEIDLPRRVYVRGRGLDSEWSGSFHITGNASNPRITGALRPVRGTFTVVGKTFTLDEGSIALPPGATDLDPELDLSAVYQGSGFQAIVGIGGTASDPQIELSSRPELPQDEVLSRILFDKTTTNLTPVEALELADAAASLATGGPGVTSLMRRALGVDVLAFQPGETEDDPGALQVGTYLQEGVFVGVHQGARAGSTGVTIEVDITDQIKAHSDVDADGRSRVGVRWQMDY